MNLEVFFRNHQYTIAALSMIGTFSAVVVALFSSIAALRASRSRISAIASINIILHSSLVGKDKPTYLVVSIRNLGTMPVHIPMGFFHWKLPFKKGLFEVLPLDHAAVDEWVAQRKYPVEIKPRGSDTFFLSDFAMFEEYAKKDFIGASLWSRVVSHFISAFVFTDEGRLFKVKFDSSLRKHLASLRRGRTG